MLLTPRLIQNTAAQCHNVGDSHCNSASELSRAQIRSVVFCGPGSTLCSKPNSAEPGEVGEQVLQTATNKCVRIMHLEEAVRSFP